MLHLRITPLRDPFCGLLLPSIFPFKGDKEADESSFTAQVKAMIIFILKSFPDAQKSPYHPSSRSFEELQTLRFPWDRFGLVPSCQMLSLPLNRDSLIAFRMDGFDILCCLLSTSSRRPPIRLLKEVSSRLSLYFEFILEQDSEYLSCAYVSQGNCCRGTIACVGPRVPQLSHLVGGGLDSFPSRDEASAHG